MVCNFDARNNSYPCITERNKYWDSQLNELRIFCQKATLFYYQIISYEAKLNNLK